MPETMSTERKGVILGVISGFLSSLGPILGKLMFQAGLPWKVVVTIRGMLPAAIMFFYALFFARYVFQIKKEHFHWFLLNGLSFAIISICHYCAIYYIDAAVATILVYTLPVFTVLLSRIILKEPFTLPKIIAMIMVFGGVLFIIEIFNITSLAAGSITKIFGIPSSVFGVAIALAAGLLSAFYTIFTRKLNQYYPGWTVNSWCYFIAFPIYFVVGAPHIASYSWSPASIGSILLISAAAMGSYSLYSLSMHYIDAGRASLFMTLDPLFSVSMAILIIGERLTLFQFIGCLLVFGGIVFMEKGHILTDRFFKKSKTKQAMDESQ